MQNSKNQIGVAFFVVASAVASFMVWERNRESQLPVSAAGATFVTEGAPTFWPPRMGESFPEMKLAAGGSVTSLSLLLRNSGATSVLIEAVGMTCVGCNAFAGAHDKGKFRGVVPQANVDSIEKYFQKFAGQSIQQDNVALVQILLYSSVMRNPSQADADEWAQHFNPGKKRNYFVIAAQAPYQNEASYAMIPGFYLLDHDLQVRSDSTGHQPKMSLYEHLLPLAGKLLRDTVPKSPADRLRSNVLPKELSLPVQAAYDAIPHKRLAFDATKSTMSEPHKQFFETYFRLIDNAVVARVSLLSSFKGGNFGRDPMAVYEPLLADAEALPAGDLELYKSDLLFVLREHRDFFSDWKTGRLPANATLAASTRVQQSSTRLRKMYTDLLTGYGTDTAANRDSFFQHLCALDFL